VLGNCLLAMLHEPTSIESETGAQLIAETLIWLRQRVDKDWPKAVS
jgi:hypothetical protein